MMPDQPTKQKMDLILPELKLLERAVAEIKRVHDQSDASINWNTGAFKENRTIIVGALCNLIIDGVNRIDPRHHDVTQQIWLELYFVVHFSGSFAFLTRNERNMVDGALGKLDKFKEAGGERLSAIMKSMACTLEYDGNMVQNAVGRREDSLIGKMPKYLSVNLPISEPEKFKELCMEIVVVVYLHPEGVDQTRIPAFLTAIGEYIEKHSQTS